VAGPEGMEKGVVLVGTLSLVRCVTGIFCDANNLEEAWERHARFHEC
jgi:hypothetical protein